MRVVILTSMRTSMRTMWVVVPPGVKPGGLFQIQTPHGDVLQVTCPPGASAGQQIPVGVPAPPGSVEVVVPPGVEPGDLFQIQTPSGDMLQVTCPPGASAGQQIPVVVPARAGSEAAAPVPAQMERVPPPPHAHARAHAHVRPSLKAAVGSIQTAQHFERKLHLIRDGKHAPPPAEMPPTEMPPTPPPPPPPPPPLPCVTASRTPATAATAADLQMARDKLGASIQGFIFHAMHKPTLARDTMTYTEEVRDLQGTRLAIIRCSAQMGAGAGSAQIVAADGSTIASVKTTSAGAECNVGGGLYATATLEGCAFDPQDRGFLSSFASKVTITRHDGSGGLKVAERKSSKGYYLVLGAIVGIATLCVGCLHMVCFAMAHHSPAVYGLTSPDGALRFPPLVCSGSSKTCAFAANATPAKFKRATKKYFDTHAPRALEANYKLDLLLMEAVHALNYGINQVANPGV